MNDEIKEILEQLEWYRKIGKKDVYYPECVLPNKKAFILLDYITNLHQENDNMEKIIRRNKYKKRILELEEVCSFLQQENERLKETNVYCNRTDCVGRIKDSRKYASVYQEKEDYKSRCEKASAELQLGINSYNNGGSRTSLFECMRVSKNILQNGSDSQ